MPHVVPSQVVDAIDAMYPHAIKQVPNNTLPASEATKLRALLDLVKQIPGELIVLTGKDYADFIHARGALSHILRWWISRGEAGGAPLINGVDLPTALRRLLIKMSDEFPTAPHGRLRFISDSALCESIELDVSTAERAFRNSEWKAACVLAGAASEAMLHWQLSLQPAAKVTGAPSAPKAHLDDWGLGSMIAVAQEIGLLKDPSGVIAAGLTRDFRNLIHPGRAKRLGQKCTRATAYSALGGMMAIIEALS